MAATDRIVWTRITMKVICASKTLKRFTLPSPACESPEETGMPDSPAVRLAKSIEALKQGFLVDRNLANKVDHGSQTAIPSSTTDMKKDVEIFGSTTLAQLPDDVPTIEAFPYLTDDFLEKLGLDDRSPELRLSKEDTEKIFKSLTLQMNLNMEDIVERLDQHRAECERQHKRCFYLMKDISTRLRDHRCIGATDPINPVFVLLEDVRFLLQEIIKSTGKLGIITCEKRMAKCWRLIIDHVQILRSELESKNTVASKSTYLCIGVLLFLTVGLLAIHLSCFYAIDYETCLMNNFVQEQQIGEPPY
nr:unnamed protein product [Callosobruchus chinensis]